MLIFGGGFGLINKSVHLLVSDEKGRNFESTTVSQSLYNAFLRFRSLKWHMAHHQGPKRVEELTENEIRKIMSRVITKVRIKSWIFFQAKR